MRSYLFYLLRGGVVFLALLLLLPACELINPEEQIPAYIYVESFTLQESPDVLAGSLDEAISHVFAYSGTDFLGIYSLPALIPVLQAGNQIIELDPGIRDNGISTSIQIYPFYERYAEEVALEPGRIDTLKPATRYRSNIRIHFIEDFEAGIPIFSEDRDGNENTKLESSNEDVFEGGRSGLILLDTLNPFFDVGTDRGQLFDLRTGGRTYLEVNYKTEVELLFAVVEIDNVGAAQSYFEFGLLPRNSWNKVYFNLTEVIRVTNADAYQIAITGGLPISNGTFALPEARVFLDNIKLISF